MEIGKRRLEFDYARTFALLFIVYIHIVEEFNLGEFGDNWWGYAAQFLQGAVGATAFMACMGACMHFAKEQSAKAYALRGIKLIGLGYALNLIRYALPELLRYWAGHDPSLLPDIWQELLWVDILQLAGLSFLVIALCVQLRMKDWQIAVLAVIFSAVGSNLNYLSTGNAMVDLVGGLIWHTDVYSNFPLLNWFIFPALGYILGNQLLKRQEQMTSARFYQRVSLLALGAMVLAWLLMPLFGSTLRELLAMDGETLYKLDFSQAAILCGIVVLWLAFLYWLQARLRLWKRVNNFAMWLSNKVNTYYCIQWILIGWTEAVWSQYAVMPQLLVIALAVMYTLVCLWLTRC